MWNLKSIIYIIAVLLVSLFIIVKKPEMHKQALITDSEYSYVEINLPPAELKPVVSDIDIKPVNPPARNIEAIPVQASRPQTVQQRPMPQTSQPKPQTAQKPQAVKQTTQPKTVELKQEQPKTVEASKPVQVQPKQQTPKQMTEQEEIIAWNKWLSRLQNQVMMDSKVLAPLGTVFKFSFTVDKYGNMSNVKVWSTNPAYTAQAVRVIKPVLMSYRNQPILNFPEGTKRIIKNFDGSFVISRTTKYSSPSDYHDYETVRR